MNTLLTKSALSAAIVLTLVACGGGVGGSSGGIAGIGGSGFTSSGSVTGFGSVFVNGVEFETDTADFVIEGISGGFQTDLSEGMRVKVSGTVNTDGVKGTAEIVEFEDQLEGPISSLCDTTSLDADGDNKTCTVLGVTVVFNSVDTVFVGTGFDFNSIKSGDNIQISGFFDANGTLLATAVVEKNAFAPSATIVEAKGTISSLTANKFTLNIGLVTLEVIAGSTSFDGLADGQFVEVKGTITAVDGTSISATLVKLEDNTPAEGSDVEIEGIIIDLTTNTFKIDGIAVDTSTLTPSNTTPTDLVLQNGIKVEVEGTVTNGVLQAATLKLREGDVEVNATSSNVNTTANTFDLTISGQTITVAVNTSTRLDDKEDFETFAQAIAKLDSQFLRVRGIDDGTGNGIIATRVRIENPADDEILQGVIQANTATSITVLGVEINVDTTTDYTKIDNTPYDDLNAFLADVTANQSVIKIKDKVAGSGGSNPTGIADEVELQEP